MAVVLTIGHGARSFDEFLAVARAVEIERIIDVRMFPGSRRHPHFAKEALERTLSEAGIGYTWRGEALGGRRKAAPDSRHYAWRNDSFRAYADHMDTDLFRSALAALESEADEGGRQAVMCAETLWWKCHRRLIADALTVDGYEVLHAIDDKPPQPHKLHEAIRVDDDGLPVYDVGVPSELPMTPD